MHFMIFHPQFEMSMQIKILLFASCRDIVGSGEIVLSVRDGITVGELKQELVVAFPGMAGIAPSLSTAVNMDYAKDDEILSSRDEVALIPPVSGGVSHAVRGPHAEKPCSADTAPGDGLG